MFVYHNVFIFYLGHCVCKCGKETGLSTGFINYSIYCEKFDEVITSFVILPLYQLLSYTQCMGAI